MKKHLNALLKYWGMIEDANEWEDAEYTPEYKTKLTAGHDVLYMFDDEEEGITYVVCTGTNWSFREWASNLWAWPFRGFHRGFYKTAKKFFDQLKDMWLPFNRKVVIIGHSRGVYSVILAYLMNNAGMWDKPHCITFGAPEFAKGKGRKKLNKSTVTHDRCYTEDDIVVGLGASKYWATTNIKLASIKGFDHTKYGQVILETMRIEEEAS